MISESTDWGRYHQWREFLSKIGLEIQVAIGRKEKVLELFRKQIGTFAGMRDAYAKAVAEDQRKRIEHWQRVKSDPQLRNQTIDLSKKGLEWNDVRQGHARETVPRIENAAVIPYSFDGGMGEFPATGGPLGEMPADHVDEYIARLTRWIAENGEQIKERHSDGGIPSAVIQIRPGVQLRQMGPLDDLENMRCELAIVQAQMPGIRDKKTNWVYTSRPWWRWLGLEEEDVFGYWRLPLRDMPPDVNAWLDKTPLSQPPDARLPTLGKTEAEIRRYVIVTGLYDRTPGIDPDRRISAGIWSDELLSMVRGRLENGRDYGLSETVLKSTWNEVKADLEKPAREPNGQRRPSEMPAGDAAGTKSLVEWAGGERVTLAIVFTDIVGSTALGKEIGDEGMSEILKAHFLQDRRLLGQYDGWEVKTIGDAFMAVFHSTGKALDFAVSLHSNSGHSRVRVRAGIHIGEVQVQDRDISGETVNYAKRVVEAAKGAEIWLSERAKADIDGLRASRHDPLKWERYDGVAMKGFSGTFTLWSLVPSAAPALSASNQIASSETSDDEQITAESTIKSEKKQGKYDVFLCHNSKDKAAVEEIAKRLKSVGIRPWLDKWDLAGGDTIADALEKAITSINCAAIFFGPADRGNWHLMEIRAYVEVWAKKQARLIPVILPDAPETPSLPIWLRQTLWVNMREWKKEGSDALYNLVCSIIGRPPGDSPKVVFTKRDVNRWRSECRP